MNNNSIEYQKMYTQVLEIKSKCQKALEKSDELRGNINSGIQIDDQIFKENKFNSIILSFNKIIDEIDNQIIPYLKQKMM